MKNTTGKSEDNSLENSGGGKVDGSDLTARLDDLNARIQSKRKENSGPDGPGKNGRVSTSAGVAQAMRMSSEFIAAICVGAGIGYLIDTFAGTTPWAMILFLFLGFGAGVLNVLRVAGLVAETNLHLGAGPGEKEDK